MKITEFFDKNKDLQAWQAGFSRAERTLLTGLSGTSEALVMANAYENNPDKYVVIVESQFRANALYDELSSLISGVDVFQFFSDDSVYAEFALASKDRVAYRLEALRFLLGEAPGFLIVPIMALRSLLPVPDTFAESYVRLENGDEFGLKRLVNLLASSGYERVQRVMRPSEFSVRGDIIDVYTLDNENPVRLEFFGDEVDTIRTFDAESQRSLQQLDSVELTPASDLILSTDEFDKGAKKLSALTKELDNQSYFEEIVSAANGHFYHQELRKFAAYFYEKSASLWDYFPANLQIFVDDFQKINEMNHKISLDLADFILVEKEMERSLEGQQYLLDTISALRNHKSITFFSNFQKGMGNLRFDKLYNFQQHSMQQFFGQLDMLYTEVDRFTRQGFTVVLAVSADKLAKRLAEMEIDFIKVDTDSLQVDRVNVTDLHVSNGFVFLDEKLVVITEAEIFGKQHKKRARRLNITNAERLKDYNELEIGDYVVHKTHGVGRYLGIQTLLVFGVHRDYLTLEYQNGDTISVPIDQLSNLTKYTAGEGKAPRINRLNDGRWRKTLSSVSKEVEDISEDLIKLYAERQASKGYAFSEDTENQAEFDAAFAYPETPDQLRSINETKRDMELARPMDRLLVGDVGFGKTEVAMRAAFKAINDHKQVAILVPTTVLAEQHYQTMSERFLDFGVNVAVLSRFQTKAQQTEILAKLKHDRIDLIVGTHRLLSQDVEFFDLGLMVVDEEQRFGVKHKERLKELKTQIDVLTLTATPIPRTLHMSMLGIHDLSVLETPPTNRYPVQTYVMEQNYGVIRDAILREISRDGQAFYVFNRVEGIEQKVEQLEELVPEARFGFIHGRMNEVQLENTLLDFIHGDYDVLVTTTIIETGVDIPSVNTIFIENADKFGLSQLYQLRGRVGRTNRVAYAYLMYQPDKVLTEVSEKRLDAIKGFTELGSGFKIAMRDLSIRGAGNLLGAEQSGFIDSVGFELYSQLLEEALTKRMKSEPTKMRTNCEIVLGLDAFLPASYIADERQKIEIYKRIRQIDSRKYYEDLGDELYDRFGGYPDEVAFLLEIGLLKHFADDALIEKIEKTPRELSISLSKNSHAIYGGQDYFEALGNCALKATVSEERGQMIFRLKPEKSDIYWLQELIKFAEKLAQIRNQKDVSRETKG
ncbi:MAG: transcription-repair coupling factor [Streptococcaceae bacterium]|jgi:transcription-repair coupling factor (superfamily II helicase)|nr:transcription-repair coupling factor [Streptococcaceae bacterium]